MFGRRKKQEQREASFHAWLSAQDKYGWLAGYVRVDGSVDRDKLRNDQQFAPNIVYAYTEDAFNELVATLYASYLNVKAFDMEHLPEGVEIRRVRPKASGNRWAVKFKAGTIYYAPTITEAISKLLERNERVKERYINSVGSDITTETNFKAEEPTDE